MGDVGVSDAVAKKDKGSLMVWVRGSKVSRGSGRRICHRKRRRFQGDMCLELCVGVSFFRHTLHNMGKEHGNMGGGLKVEQNRSEVSTLWFFKNPWMVPSWDEDPRPRSTQELLATVTPVAWPSIEVGD